MPVSTSGRPESRSAFCTEWATWSVTPGSGRTVTRPVFLYDSDRLILPAYGTYTGGLDCRAPAVAPLMRAEACAVLTGKTAVAVPMPR